jgi:hypothetical protein
MTIPNTFESYELLRRLNTDLYYQATTKAEMHQSYLKLGKCFFNTIQEEQSMEAIRAGKEEVINS